MPLSQPLDEFKESLRQLLLENPAEVLKALLKVLPTASEKYQTASTILGELNDTNKQRLRGVLSNEDLQRAYNRIRAAVLDLVESLEESDFDPEVSDARPQGQNQGEILYRIPNTMPVLQETKCIVRISATEDGSIAADIFLDEHVELKPLTRVSEVMQVELLDPAADPVFEIRSLSSPEQLVEETGYTEWQYYVKPLKEGTYPLVIKVAVIELALGKERKKEIILEEPVEVIAEAISERALGFKKSGEKFKLQNKAALLQTPSLEEAKANGGPPSPPMPPDPSPVRKKASTEKPPQEQERPMASGKRPGWQRGAALFLIFIMAGGATTWAVAPQEVSWVIARYIQDSPESMEAYAAKYPESRHAEDAIYHNAELAKNTRAYRRYIRKYPDGKHVDKAIRQVDNLEDRALLSVKRNPNQKTIRAFLDTFPRSERLEVVQDVVDSSAVLRKMFSDTLRKKIQIRDKNFLIQDINIPAAKDSLRQIKQDTPSQRKDTLIQRKDTSELTDWQETRIRNNSNTYKEFLEKYPDSKRKPSVQKRLKELRDSKRREIKKDQ